MSGEKFMSVLRRIALAIAGVMAVLAPPLAATAQPMPAEGGAASPASAESYILGPDDEIQVEVLGRTDFNVKGRIMRDGSIELPYIGALPAADRTPKQFGREVEKALVSGGYFEKPIVSVEVMTYASRYVTVLGYVAHPGLVPIDRNYRVSEVLAKAGGATPEGADYVDVRPMKGAAKHLVIRDLATGDLSQDPFVSPGDKLFVPKAEVFYVSGQVRSPGAYPITTDLTLLEAISRGGGVTQTGSLSHVKVTRQGQKTHVKLTDKVQPGDVIDVGERLF
jgi:polysaccharide export outer membrane protein